MKKTIFYLLLGLLQLNILNSSYAGLLASASRVIFYENNNEKSLMLTNTNDYPVISQIWVDDGFTGPEYPNVPFAIVPSALKLAPNEIKGIRIFYNGMILPKDRESMFWLNLYEIPSIKKDLISNNYLNLAMNTQLKIFYRPKSLKAESINHLQEQIQYQLLKNQEKWVLKINNPTPYFLNFTGLNISNERSKSKITNEQDNTLAPFSEKLYQFENSGFIKLKKNKFQYNLIDDYGFATAFSVDL